jgi:hypothetical protein
MDTMVLTAPRGNSATQAHSPAQWLAELFRREPVFAAGAALIMAAMAPTLFAMLVDTRQFNGINAWDKPFKFEVSLLLYLGTLAFYAGWLPQGMTAKRRYRIYAWLVVGAIAAELAWIIGGAANGIGSHFNVQHPVMGPLYPVMGAFAVFLTSASLVYGIAFLRDRNSTLDPAFTLSLGLGLVLTFVMTVAVAGYMSSGTGHWVGGTRSDASGFAFMGWSRDGGDLRVAHFFAAHAMHFIPAAGFIASRMLAPAAAGLAVWLASAGLAGFTVFVFMQALAGQPFLAFL